MLTQLYDRIYTMKGYTMKITKEKLFKEFKTLTTNKQKYDYLIEKKNQKEYTDLLDHLKINFDNLIRIYN